MAQQAKEREQLRLLFEEQQRQLIASVVNAVSSTSDPGTVKGHFFSDESRSLKKNEQRGPNSIF